jgi:amino acid transporter
VLLAGLGTLGLRAGSLRPPPFAGAGGVHEYLRRGVHPSVGVVGGAYLLGLLFLGAGGGYVTDGYLMDHLLRTELSLDLGWWLWALVFLAVVIAVNHTGAGAGIGAIAVTAAISAVPLAVVAVAIIADGGTDGNTLAVFDPSRTSWNAVFPPATPVRSDSASRHSGRTPGSRR